MELRLPDSCAVCGNATFKQCSRCKIVKYCSEACQRSDWKSGHKSRCRDFQLSVKGNSEQSALTLQRRKSFGNGLVPSSGKTNILNQSNKVLFPYEDFLELFYWDHPGFTPCGLMNCGNSCFANVVLQCLTHTKPLVAYLLEEDHRRECRLNGWCFLCEFQLHVERASWSWEPFSPISILSGLPNIGGNLSCGKQEDAHEFMRFAIDTMQSAFLDEFGGRTAVPPSTQETTLIQHIFGGHLQSQVICSKCSNLSSKAENMMDLTIEIHGDAESLEDCLDQFTAEECMDGENMYKCDRCNDYVKASKRLKIRKAPNILTIALKRFQGGRFGKLSKRVIFPENLDLCPNMSEEGDDNDFFMLYAVIVHVNMSGASDFGHYICYIKNFSGSWYRINDCQVVEVNVDEVLSQEAYMLLYRRIVPRPTSLYPLESLNKEDHDLVKVEGKQHCPLQPHDGHKTTASPAVCADSGSLPTANSSEIKVVKDKEALPSITNSEGGKDDQDMVESWASRKVFQELQDAGVSSAAEEIYCLRMGLSPCPFIHSSAEAVTQKPEGRFLVSEIKEKTETCEGTANEDQDMVESGTSRYVLQEHQDVGVPSAAEDTSHLRMLSSPCSFTDSSAETDERFLVSDIEENTETCERSSNEDQDMVESRANRQELQDIGVSTAAEDTSCLTLVLSPRPFVDSSAEAVTHKPEGQFLVSDIKEKTDTCEGTANEDQDMVESGTSRYVLQAHQDVGVSSAAEETSHLRTSSSPCSFTDSSAETDGRFLVSDMEEKTETCEGTANEDQDMVESRANCQELQDAGVSTAAEEIYCLRMGLSPCPFIHSSAEAVTQKPEGRFLVSDLKEKTETCEGTANEDQDVLESGSSRYVLQEHQDVGVSSAAEETSHLRMLSSPCSFTDSSAETDGRFLVSDIKGKTETYERTANDDQDMVESGANHQELQDIGVSTAAEETSCLTLVLSPRPFIDSSAEAVIQKSAAEETSCLTVVSSPRHSSAEAVIQKPEGRFLVSDIKGKTETCEGTADEDQEIVQSWANRKVLQELQDVAVSTAAEETSCLRMVLSCLRTVLSPCPCIDSSDEAVTQKPEGRFLVSDIKEKTETCEGTVNESQLESSIEDYVDTNGEMHYDASSSNSSLSEISKKDMKFDNSTLLPEKAKCEKEYSSHGIHDVILKTDGGTSSGKKLNPLFPPAFLGKRPRAKTDLSCEIRDAVGKEQKHEK